MRRAATASAMVVAAAVAATAGVVLFQRQSQSDVRRAAVAAFYRQTLVDDTGTMRAMDAHRGQVVVVNFWAPWCAPCVREIPAFSKVATDANGRVAFVGFGIDSADNIRRFAEKVRPTYPLVVAGADGTELAKAFGDASSLLPFTVVVGRDGEVVATHLGTVDEATLKGWLAPYLDARS